MTSAWRSFLRFDFALTLIALRVAAIAVLTTLNVIAAIAALVYLSRRWQMQSGIPPDMRAFMIVFYVLLPLMLGTFLAAAFAHLPRWKVWLGWLVWLAVVLSIVSLHGPFDSNLDPRVYPHDHPGLPWRFVMQGLWHVALPATLVVAAMLVLALPGVIVGKLLIRLRDGVIAARWRWRRRRRRLAAAASV